MFTDNFNRANGALGSNWDTSLSSPAPRVVSNTAQLTGLGVSDNFGIARCVALGAMADMRAQVTIPTLVDGSTDWTIELDLRLAADGTVGLTLGVGSGGDWFGYRMSTGSAIGSGGAVSFTGGSVFEARVIGHTLTGWMDGAQFCTIDVTGMEAPTGYVGFNLYRFGNHASPIVDDFEGEDLAGATRARVMLVAAQAVKRAAYF